MADFKIKITTDASQAVQGAQQTAQALEKVKQSAGATGQQVDELAKSKLKAKDSADKFTQSSGKLNLAMEGLARISPTAASAVGMLRLAMNPLGLAIAAGAAAIYGLQKAWEHFNTRLDESKIDRITHDTDALREAWLKNIEAAETLSRKVGEIRSAHDELATKLSASKAALNDWAQNAEAVMGKRKQLAELDIDKQVAEGKLTPEQAAVKKAEINQRFGAESARIKAVAAERGLEGTMGAMLQGKTQADRAAAQLPAARAMLSGMLTPEQLERGLKAREKALVDTQREITALEKKKAEGGLMGTGMLSVAEENTLADLRQREGYLKRELPSLRKTALSRSSDYRAQQALVERLEGEQLGGERMIESGRAALPGLVRAQQALRAEASLDAEIARKSMEVEKTKALAAQALAAEQETTELLNRVLNEIKNRRGAGD